MEWTCFVQRCGWDDNASSFTKIKEKFTNGKKSSFTFYLLRDIFHGASKERIDLKDFVFKCALCNGSDVTGVGRLVGTLLFKEKKIGTTVNVN